jgi:hypothetical protein
MTMTLSRSFSGASSGQFVGGQVGQLQARLVEHQLVVLAAVAGQVDEHQVFRAAALGQGAGGAGEVLAGGHGAVGHVVAVVDQGHLATGAKAP